MEYEDKQALQATSIYKADALMTLASQMEAINKCLDGLALPQ